MSMLAVIRGLGYYVPERILSNQDLEQMVDTSDEWILTRTGIRERRIAPPGMPTSDLALRSSMRALAHANLGAQDVTHVILPTITPDMPCPSAACILSYKLGLKGRVSMDMNAACSGFLYSLQVASGLTHVQPDACVLVAATDVLTSRTNFQDRSTCVLFGDGSGAAVISADKGEKYLAGIRDVILASDGSCNELLTIRGGGSKVSYRDGMPMGEEYYIQMNGREVFKHAVRNMYSICLQILEKNNLSMEDIHFFLPHQANLRIIEALAKKLKVPMDKVFVNVDRYGNTSAASVPIALAEAVEKGRIKPGYRVLATTFGAGFTWGAAILEF